jgi:hypothetical protein
MTSDFSAFDEFLAVKKEHYEHCIDVLEHDFELLDVDGTIRFHLLRCDGNGQPMVKALAEMLYGYIIDYCIASKNRVGSLDPFQYARLAKQARALFRHPNLSGGKKDATGEAGETLLFFLTEAVLQAPQIVAKMELKTNHNDEVKGSDGIHARWHEVDEVVDFFFGESKLYQNVNDAISSALKSISEFHDKEIYKHEFSIITKHFKFAHENVRAQLEKMIGTGEASEQVRLNHACLIGYDWEQYNLLKPKEIKTRIKEILGADAVTIVGNLNKKFRSFDKKHLRFDIFFLPFPSVSDFRNAFNAALD